MSTIKIDDIKEILSQSSWKLISEDYKNLDSELIFECPEGHRVFSSWKKMREKPKCPICAKKAPIQDTKIITKSANTTRVLALDQATKITGWAVYDNKQLIKYGTFETTLTDEIERCHQVRVWLSSLITAWRPDYIGFEDIQFQEESEGRRMGVTVFQTLAHLQGILMETAYEFSIPFKLCPTNTWRHHCGVKGKARTDKKRSMQLLVKQWFDMTVGEDEADAIGIGKYMADTVGKQIEVVNWE